MFYFLLIRRPFFWKIGASEREKSPLNCDTFFSVRLLSVLRGFSAPPQRPMTSDFEGLPIPDFIYYIFFPILIIEKGPVVSLLNVQCY